MQNDYPTHRQNSQSRLPLARYEWYLSRLDKFRLRGFIEAYVAEANLVMQ
jgi:hypothetical protein